MRRPHVVLGLAVLFLSFAAFASPVITSITPHEGPAAGGTTVTIHGSGFNNICVVCSPPFAEPLVLFGVSGAASAHVIDANTIEVVTSPHFPGTVGVYVGVHDGSDPDYAVIANAFTFTGDLAEDFEPILFPIFTRPVHGRFGTEFVTTPRVMALDTRVALYGYDTNCYTFDPPVLPELPFSVGSTTELLPDCSESVGRLFYVEKGRSKDLAANLRVSEVSQGALDHGTEIPVVRRTDFREGRIALLGVPIDTRFRNTLRIYGLNHEISLVSVTMGNETRQIGLTTSADPFTPAYAELSDFPLPSDLPAGQTTITVTVEPARLGVFLPPNPIWAFISVTNNETQRITVITP